MMPKIYEIKAKAKESQRKWTFVDLEKKPAPVEQPEVAKEEEKVQNDCEASKNLKIQSLEVRYQQARAEVS